MGLSKDICREWVISLEAFRGHEADEYQYLIEPLTELVFKNGCIGGINEFLQAILDSRPKTTLMEIESPVTAQFLATQIKPEIEDIRQTLFHSKSAPFSCIKDAETWWNEAERRTDEWRRGVDEWRRGVDEWRRRRDEWVSKWQTMLDKYPHLEGGIEKWSAMSKQGIEVELPKREEWQQLNEIDRYVESLEVGGPPEQEERVEVYGALLDRILKICKATGFTVESVKMHILADASPILSPYTFAISSETYSLPDGTSFLYRFARITIRGELKFEELRSLYRGIRRELGIKRSKRLKTRHLELYQIVTTRGGIPNRGKMAFWESIKKEWNSLHPQNKYKTWKGVNVAYERTMAHFERRITTRRAQNERSHSQEIQE